MNTNLQVRQYMRQMNPNYTKPSTVKVSQARRFKEEKEQFKTVNNQLSLDQLRLQFLANMNHELRTPLNGLMGAAELLSLTELDAEQRHYLDIFRNSNQQLLSLIENILDFSKMLSGEFILYKNHFDIKQVLKECNEHFLPFARKKNLSLDFEIADSLPRWMYGDAKRLSQIVYHLVGNAIKFTHEGGVAVTVSCECDQVEFKVRDSGIGISTKKQSLIFEAFYQEDSSHTRQYGGAGMGLAISRFLVKAMEGDLLMSSEPNRGSEFHVRFPYLFGAEAEVLDPSLGGRAQPRILLVEDNEINQAIVYLLFSKRGIHIDIAQNGLEGLNSHRTLAYDLIFMDMQMPVMDGIEATRQIRKFDEEVQIIALTANFSPEEKRRALEVGMNDFLPKPLNQACMERLVNQARIRLSN